MAAEEHEPELVVGDDLDEAVEGFALRGGVRVGGLGVHLVGSDVAVNAGRFAAEPVDRPVACGGGDPAAGVRRDPSLRPLLGGDREGFRHGVLGEVDVAEDADQRGGAAAGLASEDSVEGVGHPCIGRTSIGPPLAAAPRAARWSATSRSAAWMIQKPPICSFVSA